MGNFNNLPTDIQQDILTRLPTESVLDCKSVCKPWRNLVSHYPSFSRMHLKHLNHSLDSGKLSFLLTGKTTKQLHYFEYNESHDETLIHSTRRLSLTPPCKEGYIVIGSINGLVCLFSYLDHTFLICNPVSKFKEYLVLPKFKKGCGDEYIRCSTGYGYLPLTNEYKVVLLHQLEREPSFIDVWVYTLGSGKGWRNVGKYEYASPISYETGVYANGALHWREGGDKGIVLVYDLTEEKFREHLSPPPVRPQGSCLAYFIGEFAGGLYYSISHSISHVVMGRLRYDVLYDVWLLKEKKDDIRDMKQQPLCWTKVFSLPAKEPLAFTKGGGVLCVNYRSLDIYNATGSTLSKLVDFGAFDKIFSHKNTLISLKELAMGEEDIKVMESLVAVENTETRELSTKRLRR